MPARPFVWRVSLAPHIPRHGQNQPMPPLPPAEGEFRNRAVDFRAFSCLFVVNRPAFSNKIFCEAKFPQFFIFHSSFFILNS